MTHRPRFGTFDIAHAESVFGHLLRTEDASPPAPEIRYELPDVLAHSPVADYIKQAGDELARMRSAVIDRLLRECAGHDDGQRAVAEGWSLRTYTHDPRMEKPDVTYVIAPNGHHAARFWIEWPKIGDDDHTVRVRAERLPE